MKIGIITPAPPNSSFGNRVTALRWAKILRKLGHGVSVSQSYEQQRLDLLIALHARRSHPSIIRFHRQHPDKPILVALTGTDVYRDIRIGRRARNSMRLANRIVALQPLASRQLTASERRKTAVIYQSVEPMRVSLKSGSTTVSEHFDVCVIGHLRPVKDPFRTALATRRLPASSRIRIIHVGGALSKEMEQRARREMEMNHRYDWLGELSRPRTLGLLAVSRACVISSQIEGGANVLSEAIVARVPVLASRIEGNVGILGKDYPGLFEVGNTGELTELLWRAENDQEFLQKLQSRVKRLAPLFDPKRELRAWDRILRMQL